MEIESKLSNLDTKQYYQTTSISFEDRHNLDVSEQVSDCDSEDVDTISHRYDPPNFQRDIPQSHLETSGIGKSLAEELQGAACAEVAKRSHENEVTTNYRNEPPPDILVSSNCRRKIWPQLDIDNENNEDFNEGMKNQNDKVRRYCWFVFNSILLCQILLHFFDKKFRENNAITKTVDFTKYFFS